MEKIKLPPQKEKKVKMLTVPVTSKEHEIIRNYCQDKNVTLTSLVRFALKSTYQINLS